MVQKFDQIILKTQLKLALSRLKLQKSKKDNLVKNQKREIADLLRSGKDESARIKVEGIIRDDFLIEAYEIIELFIELLLSRLGVINISKECPADITEAVCTLIYCAARTDIKEMATIREQLISKFGKEFGNNAITNKEGCVNSRVIHKLSVQTPENYLVFQYLKEIAKSNNLEWKADFEPQIEDLVHTKIHDPVDDNIMTRRPIEPSFPQVPQTQSFSQVTPSFPQVPQTQSFSQVTPFFPQVPETQSFPQVPSFPQTPNFSPIPPPYTQPPTSQSFPEVPVPTFNANNFSNNGTIRFPPPPAFSDTPQFPNNPQFPSPPISQKNEFPDIPNFPSVPSSNVPSFPSPPSVQSNSSSTVPPADNSLPDFDELTARFEKLKKRDL